MKRLMKTKPGIKPARLQTKPVANAVTVRPCVTVEHADVVGNKSLIVGDQVLIESVRGCRHEVGSKLRGLANQFESDTFHDRPVRAAHIIVVFEKAP